MWPMNGFVISVSACKIEHICDNLIERKSHIILNFEEWFEIYYIIMVWNIIDSCLYTNELSNDLIWNYMFYYVICAIIMHVHYTL